MVLLLGDEQEALTAGARGVDLARQARQLAVEDVGGRAAEVDRRSAVRSAASRRRDFGRRGGAARASTSALTSAAGTSSSSGGAVSSPWARRTS